MKSFANDLKTKILEVGFSKDEQEQDKKSKFILALNTVWQHLITILTKQPELQVRQRYNRFGNTWWEAYDLMTGSTVSFGSEIEMLAWIEQRYYQ